MRTKNAFKNLITAWLGQLCIQLLVFVSRSIFIRILGEQYLGVNGLFSNILSVLSLAELGIGTAITFALYAPLATKNESALASLMEFYKKAYWVIGSIVLVFGAVLTPFLNFFIKGPVDIPNLRVIYLIFVADSAMSYFYAYKAALITADQKAYIVNLNKTIFEILKQCLRIAVLLLTGNYLLYLMIQVLTTLLTNFFLTKKANRMYPFLRNKKPNKLDKAELASIKKNTFAMLFHKIGEVIVFSSDNIIISKFVGIASVGLYSNYYLIITTLQNLLGYITTSITAGIGNFTATEEPKKQLQLFNEVFFLEAWFYGFSAVSLLCLFNPFIRLWLGEAYLFDMYIVIGIVLNFYLTGMRQTTLIFRSVLGLFWYDRYKALAEAAINIAASILLALRLGVLGVIIGTAISTLTTCLWVEPYILFKYGLKNGRMISYFARFIVYASVTAAVCFVTYTLCGLFDGGTVSAFILQVLVCLFVPNLLFFLLSFHLNEFIQVKALLVTNIFNKLPFSRRGV